MGRRDAQHGYKFLEGPSHAAMLRAVFHDAAIIPEEPSVHTSVNLRSSQLISEVDALIDSGATDNFISPIIVKQFNIPSRTLNTPVKIRNVDGTPHKNGKIDQAVDLILNFKHKKYDQQFYVADLGSDHMLLGMPFLTATDPNISWTRRTLDGKIEACAPDAYHKPFPNQFMEPVQMKKTLEEERLCRILSEVTHQDEDENEESLVV
jgi:gag-polyprotein putative aspartyl protease